MRLVVTPTEGFHFVRMLELVFSELEKSVGVSGVKRQVNGASGAKHIFTIPQ